MRLDGTKALQAPGEEIPFAVEIELAPVSYLGEDIAFDLPSLLAGTMVSIGDSIRVKGMLSFAATARCALCLHPVRSSFQANVDAVFIPAPDADNPDPYLYDGVFIDPGDMAADTALLALPMQWRCVEDCKGLCPVCGVNLNDTPCSCVRESGGPHPFSALRQLLSEDESEV